MYYSLFKWRVVANLTSSLGYDASSLGNHEFDDGVSDLEAFSHATKDSYPLLACNLDISQVPSLNGTILPYVIKEVGDHRRKVAIIGKESYIHRQVLLLAREMSIRENGVLRDSVADVL